MSGHHGAPELQHLALELIDALAVLGAVGREHRLLDLCDVVVELGDDRLVVVDDPVHDRVQDRARSPPQQLGAALDVEADVVEFARRAVADRHDEAVADEEQDLAEVDVVGLDVARGLQDHEKRGAVDLELRALVGVDRVLHRELVEAELAPDGVELLLGGLVEADPRERLRAMAGLEEMVERQLALVAHPSSLERVVDDHSDDPIRELAPSTQRRRVSPAARSQPDLDGVRARQRRGERHPAPLRPVDGQRPPVRGPARRPRRSRPTREGTRSPRSRGGAGLDATRSASPTESRRTTDASCASSARQPAQPSTWARTAADASASS